MPPCSKAEHKKVVVSKPMSIPQRSWKSLYRLFELALFVPRVALLGSSHDRHGDAGALSLEVFMAISSHGHTFVRVGVSAWRSH